MSCRALLTFVFCSALCGCASSFNPQKRDTLAELNAAGARLQGPGLKKLTVAVVMSQKTQDSMRYQGGFSDMPWFMPAPWFMGMSARVGSRFKNAVPAGSLDEAMSLGTDLIAVVDDYAALNFSGMKVRLELSMGVILLSPDGRTVDEIRGDPFDESRVVWSYSIAKKAVAQAEGSFDRAWDASEKLAAFARDRAAAPAVIAATAPRVYRSEVDTPAYKREPAPNDFAVVIGVERYSALPEAEFAERDAAAVKAHLMALGFPERNIGLLTGTQASRAGVAKMVESWLPKHAGADSRVFFYYSGHGAPDVKTGQAYLLPWDADAQFLEATAYPLKRLYQELNQLKARQVFVALDSCFSGAGGRSVLARGTRPLVLKVDPGTDAVGRLVILTASGADEITGTDQEQGHGVFTFEFLRALSGASGRATMLKLHDALVPRVQDAARRANRDQTPRLIGDGAAAL